ncbi:helix-turn-helix domain-containing protein [Streptococcus uberis]|uniref:helix-turn-helix domain-containing protein n=1 Tax=Streptococcus uberis TaxID=1349 RepID=UPI0038B5D0B5
MSTNKLKELREKEKISLSTLSKKLKSQFDFKVSPSQLMYYENGTRSPRDDSTWKVLANFFNVPLAYLLGYVDKTEEDIWNEYLDEHLDDPIDSTPLEKTQISAGKSIFLSIRTPEDLEKLKNRLIESYTNFSFKIEEEFSNIVEKRPNIEEEITKSAEKNAVDTLNSFFKSLTMLNGNEIEVLSNFIMLSKEEQKMVIEMVKALSNK